MSRVRQLGKWATAPVETTLLQVPRALVVSVLALALDVGLYELLVRQLGLHVVPAATIGYLAGGMVQYVLCSVWVFPASPVNHTVGFVAFTVLSLVGLAMTCVIVYLLYDLAGVNEFFAKIAAVGVAFTWNFLSRKFLLFKPAPVEISSQSCFETSAASNVTNPKDASPCRTPIPSRSSAPAQPV
jgi:putative flippase GtrA